MEKVKSKITLPYNMGDDSYVFMDKVEFFNYVKRKFGPDLEGFYRQLDRVNQRLSGTISAQQREIDKIYGRPIKSSPSISSAQKKPEGPAVVEKIINGQKRKFQLNPATGKYKEVK